jgi:hypothetical protein
MVWAAAAFVAIAGTSGFLLNRDWTAPAPPPLELHSTDSDGTLVIRWNNDAVRDVDHAEMFIDDGGRVHAVPLDRSQLSLGELHYTRKSPHVTAKMNAGSAQAVTSFAAPARRPKSAPEAPRR